MTKANGGDTSADIDMAAALGAEADVSTQCLAIYIPNKDRNGEEKGNQRKWILEAIALLSDINGGATAMPPVEGGWRGDQGKIVWENPVVVYSFIQAAVFLARLPAVREFIHRMGRETNQGEIGVEFGRRFYRIRKFDHPTSGDKS